MSDNNVTGSGNYVSQVTHSPGAIINQNIQHEESPDYSFKKHFSISINWIFLPLFLLLLSGGYIYHNFKEMHFARPDFHSATLIISLHKLSFSVAGASTILFCLFIMALLKILFKRKGVFSPFFSFWLDSVSGKILFGKIEGKCPRQNCDGVLSVVRAKENHQGIKYIGRCNKERNLHNYTYEKSNNGGARVQLLQSVKQAAHKSSNNIFGSKG